MKTTASITTRGLAVLGGLALVSSAFAGTPSAKEPVAVTPEEASPVSGTLTLAANTHFMSYGLDVWGAGTDYDDVLFNPSIELVYDLGGGFSAILGTWFDVNDNAVSSISNKIQEVDVWAGVGYKTGDWSFTLLYQEWMYASQSERIVDFKVGYTHFLNPSVTFHGRVDGAEPFDTGLVTVLGIAPGTELGPVALSFPVQVAASTDGFHGGDAGFSFASAGITATLPLGAGWSVAANATYYHTEDSVIVSNPESDFVTGTLSLALAF